MSVSQTVKKLAEEELVKETAENEAAVEAAAVEDGYVLVRLIRPLQKPLGGLYPPGIHTLLKEQVPKSAIVLK